MSIDVHFFPRRKATVVSISSISAIRPSVTIRLKFHILPLIKALCITHLHDANCGLRPAVCELLDPLPVEKLCAHVAQEPTCAIDGIFPAPNAATWVGSSTRQMHSTSSHGGESDAMMQELWRGTETDEETGQRENQWLCSSKKYKNKPVSSA